MKLEEMDGLRLERSADEVWKETLAVLRKRVKPGTGAFLSSLRAKEVTDSEIVLYASNDFAKNIVLKSRQDIELAVCEQLGKKLDLRIEVTNEPAPPEQYNASIANITVTPPRIDATTNGGIDPAAPINSYQQEVRLQASNLNPKYTFESFVVGSHNRFTHSAAMAIAERPGETYNPLFIYGGVGLGKTHIMQAVGNHVIRRNPKAVVLYITCERFTNDLINSIGQNRMIEFRKRYRQADVLLVDDIQFIGGKESTQEEFFHTFNSLRESGRQIIISSDRPPKELPKLEERLRSRFEWGLIADVQPPDLETRVAILRRKCETDRMTVPDQVLEYIATTVTSNIRELEGALLRAHAYTNFSGKPLNLLTAADVLQVGAPSTPKNNITADNIINAVATHYKVEASDIRSTNRSKDLAGPRHIAMFLIHDVLNMSHSRIGEHFANRKHSSIIYAIDKIKKEIAETPQLSLSVQQIRRQLGI